MNARGWCAGLILVTGSFALAGEISPYEQTLKQMLKNLDEINMVLKTIESEDNAIAAKPKLRLSADSWIEARTRAAKLPPPERSEKERLVKLYKPKLDETLRKLFVEVRRVEVIPGGPEALKEISGVLQKEGK